jgi:outer membrane receptor protein involved in Fe transport
MRGAAFHLIGGTLAAAALGATPAAAQDTPTGKTGEIDEIVVTALKREQSDTSVGLSITAASADTLLARGIDSVADLPRLVPGLTIQESNFASTSFTLRGVGFFNSDLSTPPAVTVYVDEAPLPYPAMTRLAAFDLARVEVLKGPQGTLFGQNATGGAVNYIAATPSNTLQTGADLSFGRFNRLQIGGFVSGSLAKGLTARLAMQGRWGDGWQKSITRPGDTLGRIAEFQARATVDWSPGDRLSTRLTLTFTHDGSERPAGQFVAAVPPRPALAVPGLLTFPVVKTPRAADWSLFRADTGERIDYASDTALLHLRWRTDYWITDDVTLTSLTSYARLDLAYAQDPNGTPFSLNEVIDDDGKIASFFHEFRVAGRRGNINWLAGVNYAHDKISDEPRQIFRDVDASHLFERIDPLAYVDANQLRNRTRVQTYAAFGRIEYALSDKLMVEGALRYNIDRRRFDSCALAVTDHFARFWNLFRGNREPLTRPGDCYVLDPANDLQPVDNVHNVLNENSLSWRIGLNWTARPGLLAYVNASRGYKAGTSPVAAVSTVNQYTPIGQESVLAYEAGLKATLFDRRVQFAASGFYYDYRDKQLRSARLDPPFGPLEALASIPKSHVIGAEVQIVARPFDGLTLDTSATYTHTEIDRFVGYDGLTNFGDQAGTRFPFAPAWQSITNLDYEFPVSRRIRGFFGGSLTHRSGTYAGVGMREALRIDPYTLLDLRAGLEISGRGGGRYRIWVWGRNVANEYYWTNVFSNANAVSRFIGQPATYGLTLSSRF